MLASVQWTKIILGDLVASIVTDEKPQSGFSMSQPQSLMRLFTTKNWLLCVKLATQQILTQFDPNKDLFYDEKLASGR